MENNKNNSGAALAKKMAVSLVCGLVAGFAFMMLREKLNASGNSALWKTINDLLFQDITAEGAEQAFGIFYIIGQLFIKALQLVIIPMVFTSISLAIGSISDTRTMGRIASKTLFWFLWVLSWHCCWQALWAIPRSLWACSMHTSRAWPRLPVLPAPTL